MRVLHVVPWISKDNPFGGPITVALGQTAELERRGHEVRVVAGGRVDGALSDELSRQGVTVMRSFRVLPGLGFSGVVSPRLLWWIARHAGDYDVVHVHVCRDLVAMPAAFIAELRGRRVVLQPHGMVDGSQRRLARWWDRVMTRRVFRRAGAVLTLTDRERNDITTVTGRSPDRIDILPNGIAPAEFVKEPERQRAQLLFCSRLHARKRPQLFVRAAIQLVRSGVEADFLLVGPDEGEGAAIDGILQSIGGSTIKRAPAVSPSDVPGLLAEAAVLVLPSVDEPFPMIVLEAMSIGRPVIVSDSCGLAHFVSVHGAGLVVRSDDEASLVEAMSTLAQSATLRSSMGRAGYEAVGAHLTIRAVVDQLEAIYQRPGAS